MFILNKKCIQFVNLDDTMFQKKLNYLCYTYNGYGIGNHKSYWLNKRVASQSDLPPSSHPIVCNHDSNKTKTLMSRFQNVASETHVEGDVTVTTSTFYASYGRST